MDDLLTNAPCGFLSLTDDGTIHYANDTLGGMLKANPATLVGRHVDHILTPGARIFYQTHAFPLLRTRGSLGELYISLRSADGGEVPVLLNAARRVEADGARSDWVVVPMRRRYEFEDQLQAARREAENANRAKSNLLAIVSHDIRTPLNAMSLGIELLTSEAMGPLSSDQRKILDRIVHASQNAAYLVDELLTYATLQTHPREIVLEPVDLDALLRESGELVSARADRAGLVLGVVPCPDVTVLADRGPLKQAVVNLLTNAIDHSAQGQRIEVTCELENGSAAFSVRDYGCGIPEDRLDDIFEPFLQLASDRTAGTAGVGLGLAISRDFVRAMGGELTVESRLHHGATFRVVLPTPPAAAAT